MPDPARRIDVLAGTYAAGKSRFENDTIVAVNTAVGKANSRRRLQNR